jgi:ribosomal protein S18 acetylase RimI-like enzyme
MRVLMAGAQTQQVRAAVPADAWALAPLCAAHADFERLPYSAAGHAERLHAALARGLLHAWLLEEGGRAVGYASVTLDFATLSGRHFAHLDCLYLAPAARGQGGGQALVQMAQAFAMAQGCKELQWQTPDWNHPALHFYDRLGATRTAKQRYTLASRATISSPVKPPL